MFEKLFALPISIWVRVHSRIKLLRRNVNVYLSTHHGHLTMENTTTLVFEITLVFLSGLVQNILNNEMGEEVTPWDSFLYGPAFTNLCMCIITYQSKVPQRHSKENVAIQNSSINEQISNLINSLIPMNPMSINVRDKMTSLHWWFHHQRSGRYKIP